MDFFLLTGWIDIRKTWADLRDGYRSAKKRMETKSGQAANPDQGKSSWPYFNSMRFVDDENRADETR